MSTSRIVIGSLLALALSALVVPAVRAQEPEVPTENAFTRGQLEVDPDEIHVALEAHHDLGEPRIRTESGFVRLWFPSMPGWSSVDMDGDGGAIRFVRARPGADDTGVVVLRLGDGRRLAESAVGVRRSGNRTVITIARAALPPVAGEPIPELVAPSEPAPPAVAGTSAEPPAPRPAVADDIRSAAEAFEAAPAEETATPASPPTLGIPTPAGASHLAVLVGFTIALGAALALVQWFRTRAPNQGNGPSIRIVAATRLSQRQQLVVVRALGQDHLIALEPGRTERLLSIPTPDAPRTDDEPVPELRLSPRPFAGESPIAMASFSAELSRLFAASPDTRGGAPTMAAAPVAAKSDAVAGLMKLRAAQSR